MKRALALFFALMMLFSTALAEDAVVTESAEEEEEFTDTTGFTPIPWDAEVMPYAPHEECYLPDNAGYHDDSLDIRIETFRRDDTNVMAIYVTVADASQIRTGIAGTWRNKRTAPVSQTLQKYGGVLGINGDYYTYHSQGIVVRNTEQIRFNPVAGRETLIIDENGDFTILSPTTKEAFNNFEGTVVHAFCFGPGLVIDGEPLTDLSTVTMDNGKGKKTQRMAIGQLGHLSYLILTCEGPENEGSVGFDLLQMAALCKELGCINAYNLDGGSSSTVAMRGEKINATSSNKVRSVSDIIFFATLVP